MDILYNHAEYGVARTSNAAGGGAKKFDVFVFSSVTVLNGKDVNAILPLSCLSLKTTSLSLDIGMFVIVHTRSNLSRRCCSGANTEC